MMNAASKDKSMAGVAGGSSGHDDPYSLYKPHTKYIVDEIVRSFNEGKLVYCRFGKQYVQNLER